MKDLREFPKDVSLGRGYQSVVNKVAFNSALKTFEADDNTNKQITIHVETSNALDDVTTKVNAALSVSTGDLPVPVSATASVKSHFEKTHKETHTYTVITVDKISRSTSYKNATLDDEALALLNGTEEDLKDFYAKYGDGFIQSITYGNKIVLVLRTDKKETASLKQLETELGAKIQNAEVAAKLNALRQKLNSVKTEDRLFISIGNNDYFETKSETEEQSLSKPEPVTLEEAKFQAPKADAAKPEAAKPEVPKPDATKTDAAKAEAAKPDATKTAVAKAAEVAKPEAPKPDAPKADAAKPDAPQAGEAAKPEAKKPEADKSKTDNSANSGDFDKRLAAYLSSDSTAIIDYNKEPYSSVKNVKVAAAAKLSTLSNELGLFLLRINVCLKKIEETKILDPNNIVEQNTYPAKTRDGYYELYEALRKQLVIFQEELMRFAGKYGKTKTPLTQTEKTELEKSLNQIEDFLAKNEKSLKKAPSLTLIRKVVLSKGSAKTKGFNLDFSGNLKSTTRLLFVHTDDKDAEQIQVLMQKYKVLLFTCPTEETAVSARGCYFPANIGRNALGVKLITPDELDHDIEIRIYAATEATLPECEITSLNERARKTRPLDGAVGEDFVMEEAEARKQGYLNYNKEDKSDAALSSDAGFDYEEGEEFELETVEEHNNEIGQNNNNLSVKPKGL